MAAGSAAFPVVALPSLPWPENALQPVISASTICFHCGKHRGTYVDTLNKDVAGTGFAQMPLDESSERPEAKPARRRYFTTRRKSGSITSIGIAFVLTVAGNHPHRSSKRSTLHFECVG
jgi:superoxide dismutase